MSSRKRQRLNSSTTARTTDNDTATAHTAVSCTSAPLTNQRSTPSGTSYFLNGGVSETTSHSLPTNILLTICDENSNASHEYYTIDSNALAAHIKLEDDVGTNDETTPTIQPAAIQYRILNTINQQHQLPNGCEIYLFRQIADKTTTMSPSADVSAATCSGIVQQQNANTLVTPPIKLDPENNGNVNKYDTPNSKMLLIDTTTADAASATVAASSTSNTTLRRDSNMSISNNNLLHNKSTVGVELTTINRQGATLQENYRKRDDKRRATHNEVERRRRDKINYWIFKLKEMLPKEENINTNSWHQLQCASNITNNNNSSKNCSGTISGEKAVTMSMSTTLPAITGAATITSNGRTPPNDSKSQILIRACDYIKTMQTEIVGLREFISENEKLRTMNQQLENELGTLREQIFLQQTKNCITNTSFVTLNALNSSGDPFGGIEATTAAVDFTKRELIITDYVD